MRIGKIHIIIQVHIILYKGDHVSGPSFVKYNQLTFFSSKNRMQRDEFIFIVVIIV